MNIKTLGLVLVLFDLYGCTGRDLGDKTTRIRWQKHLNDIEFAKYWQAEAFTQTKVFGPQYREISLYDYEGIQIIIAEARFDSADLAFGFRSQLTAEPRNTFESDIWYRPPYIAGQEKKTVAFSFSPNQESFFSPYIQNEIKRRLHGTHSEEKDFSWHKDILPTANRFADSEFFLPVYRAHEVSLNSVYGAKYQSKNLIARLYIGRYQNEETAADTRDLLIANLSKARHRTTAYPGRLGSNDRGTWWKNSSGGTDAILAYRWLVLYFQNYTDEWHLEQAIQECFTQMQRIRQRALNEP